MKIEDIGIKEASGQSVVTFLARYEETIRAAQALTRKFYQTL